MLPGSNCPGDVLGWVALAFALSRCRLAGLKNS
jgi:hypothetical protein